MGHQQTTLLAAGNDEHVSGNTHGADDAKTSDSKGTERPAAAAPTVAKQKHFVIPKTKPVSVPPTPAVPVFSKPAGVQTPAVQPKQAEVPSKPFPVKQPPEVVPTPPPVKKTPPPVLQTPKAKAKAALAAQRAAEARLFDAVAEKTTETTPANDAVQKQAETKDTTCDKPVKSPPSAEPRSPSRRISANAAKLCGKSPAREKIIAGPPLPSQLTTPKDLMSVVLSVVRELDPDRSVSPVRESGDDQDAERAKAKAPRVKEKAAKNSEGDIADTEPSVLEHALQRRLG